MVCDALVNAGDTLARFDLGLGGFFGPSQDLALGASGTLMFTQNASSFQVPPGSSLLLNGIGEQVAAFRYGHVVAVDAAGNFYVAGGFTEAIDFGLGSLSPKGDIDTFVVKIGPKGRVLAQFALGECGDGVDSIAVSRDGRIAVSGAAMGTVVADKTGNVLFRAEASGDVAFDSKGNLVIGGGRMVVKLDRSGNRLASYSFTGDGGINAIAVGPHDEIAFVGDYARSINLFGTTYVARFGPEARLDGVFVALLDIDGKVLFKDGNMFALEFNDVAFAPNGNLVISGATLSNAFNRQSLVFSIDQGGQLVFSRGEFPLPGASMAHGLAVNQCGDVFVSIDASRNNLDMHQFILELAH